MMGLVAIFILILSGLSKSFLDLSSEGNLPFKGDYFNKQKSWKFKWKIKDGELIPATKGDNWWYFGIIKPRYKEKFIFSSTLLVYTTDFWHLAQFVFLKTLIIGVYYYQPITNYQIIDLVVVFTCVLVPFELLYTFLKHKK
jgi:hypothetical protein